MSSSAFDKLFNTNVPHVLEKIFFSLDYESFKACHEVCRGWKELLSTANFTLKATKMFITGQWSGAGATIFYTFPSTKEKETLPYMIKLDQYHFSLKDVKDRCPRKGQQYRYFFKTAFEGYEVFEEIHDDAAAVPMFGGLKIVVECRGSDC